MLLRCPICRDLIRIPAGGVMAFPPSFLVNQLIDLMARQTREILTNCAQHESQELMFCETCDLTFCASCVGGSHPNSNETISNKSSFLGHRSHLPESGHTVLPLSVASKRMSEIASYKASECNSKLDWAEAAVTEELERLDRLTDSAHNSVNRLFEELAEVLEKKRLEVISDVRRRRTEKRRVLEQQLSQLQSQRCSVASDFSLKSDQFNLKSVRGKIRELSLQLDSISKLSEPRENSYIEFHRVGSQSFESSFGKLLREVGKVKTSKTYPSLCRATIETAICSLETVAVVQTRDCQGNIQDCGGDPVTAEVVFIFARAIKDCPLMFNVTSHNAPILSFGQHGSGESGFIQPCNLALDRENNIYVVDTGNSRIKVLDSNFVFRRHIRCPQMDGQGVTGLCMGLNQDTLVSVNWRTKKVAEMTLDGEEVGWFTHDEMVEPIGVSVTAQGQFVVLDSGVGIMVFDQSGNLIREMKIMRKLGEKMEFKDVMSVCVTVRGDIVVADTRIMVFDFEGNFIREFGWKSLKEGCRGRYQGLAMDRNGMLLAARSDKTGSHIQVFNYEEGSLHSVIDSHGAKLKRPTGIAVGDRYVYIVDIGADCIRKFRYK